MTTHYLKNITILIIMALVLTYVFSTNMYLLDNLPWNFNAPIKHNMAPYIVIFLAFISPYLCINTLWGLKEAVIKTKSQTIKSIGIITSIEYSGYIVNNKPRFKVSVSYKGVYKSFNALTEEIQFHFNIGDESIIYHNPENLKDAFFDMEASISHNRNKT
jgi:phosphopantetheinyl transferase (holo-ACP synthase)